MSALFTSWTEQIPWVKSQLFGNAVWTWIAAVATALLVFSALRLTRWGLQRALARASASGEEFRFDGALDLARAFLDSTRGWFLSLLGLGMARPWLTLSEGYSQGFTVVVTMGLSLQIALWLDRLLRVWLDRITSKREADDAAQLTSFAAVRFLGQLVIWSVVLLLSLDNLGVNVSALVAGFGIGGIAVALAAQNLLGDLFASLSIVLDRPFEVGDFVIVGDFMGAVEKIGLKTTRVRSLSGEQITFGNTDLLGSRIRNYKRMQERRVAFELDVVHGTAAADLREIPRLAREAIEGLENTRFDRAHLKQIHPTALRYEIVYYVGTNDFTQYMDIQQAINLELLDQLEQREVRLAHPTYAVRIEGENSKELEHASR